MTEHPFRTAATTTAGIYTGVLLEAGVKRTILVLGVSETLGDFTFTVGEIPLAVAWAKTGYVYYYDSTDATTPDDGLTTLVSGNGLRYAIEDSATISLNSVLGMVTVPTGAETVGDAYIVSAAATGVFAGRDDNQAFLTRRGWVFAVPEIGATVLNEATGQNTQFTEAGWGAFAVAFADGSIPPKALLFPGGIVAENTLNAPPGSPTTGKFWIVGSAPTGAFSGHSADLAYWTGTAWAFMAPSDGWAAFHKAFGFEVFYVSGSWLGGAGSDLQTFSTAGAATWVKPARGTMAFIQVWGAGGSGGRAGSSDGGGGGGGGGYNERWVPLASLGASESVTVGAGGAARTVDDTDGLAGGNSSFGAWLTGYGGGGGVGNNGGGSGGGGGGGGQYGAGAGASGGSGGAGGTASPGDSAGTGAAPGGVGGKSQTGGGGGGGGSAGADLTGGGSTTGGGGGGGGNDSADGTPNKGGASMRGGGGGGGGGSTSARFGTGGVSREGGSGGAGGYDANAGAAGGQPGGGGGGSENGNSGKGGDGLVRVTVF